MPDLTHCIVLSYLYVRPEPLVSVKTACRLIHHFALQEGKNLLHSGWRSEKRPDWQQGLSDNSSPGFHIAVCPALSALHLLNECKCSASSYWHFAFPSHS